MNDNERIKKLSSLIDRGGVVFFGGAGVSTESGIPDFRSENGLYSRKYDHPPEEMLSHGFFAYSRVFRVLREGDTVLPRCQSESGAPPLRKVGERGASRRGRNSEYRRIAHRGGQ